MEARTEIAYLADHPHLIPTLAAAFIEEWAGYYGPEGRGDAVSDLRSRQSKSRLPIALVALVTGQLRGTVTLQATTESHTHLGPWLTALFVLPDFRRQGIATGMIHAAEHLADLLGYEHLYTRTGTAVQLFARMGWTAFDTVVSGNQSLTVFRKEPNHRLSTVRFSGSFHGITNSHH